MSENENGSVPKRTPRRVALILVKGEIKTIAGEPDVVEMIGGKLAVVDNQKQAEIYIAGYNAGKSAQQ